DLWHDFDRQRAGIGTGLVERRSAPRLDPQLQSADRVRAGQRGAGPDPVLGGAGAAALRPKTQLFGAGSAGLFCLGLNSKILRSTPGAIAEIGLTRSSGAPGVPTTS